MLPLWDIARSGGMDGAASNYFAEMTRIGLAGDVMLGRLVDGHVLANSAASPGYVWGNTLPVWRQMDLRMVNLECVIATAGEPWVPKTFHFRAGPRRSTCLRPLASNWSASLTITCWISEARPCRNAWRGCGSPQSGTPVRERPAKRRRLPPCLPEMV